MKANREHLLQNGGRRLDMQDILLGRPGPEAFYLNPFLNGDSYILMPWDLPVGLRDLVKKNASDGKSLLSKNRFYQSPSRYRAGKGTNFGTNIQEISNASPLPGGFLPSDTF
jgi:hypothetical protein